MIKATDQKIISAWRRAGGRAYQAAAMLGITERALYYRRSAIERKYGVQLKASGDNTGAGRADTPANSYLSRHTIEDFSGQIVVFSDCHYWPGRGATVAHRALVEVVKEIKPKIILGNGDLFDGARLSRFPRNGWEEQPRVIDELDEAKERLAEVRKAHSRAYLIRTCGNHDVRVDRYLAVNAGEFEGVAGFRLADHLPEWKECMSVFVNGNTMIKHRYHGGVHAGYNNTLRAGTNIVTGHTHHLEVKPWSDYRGRRYGVQTGAIADSDGAQFGYTENNPTPWCSGFAVLTFTKEGRLVMPDLCEVIDGEAWFRGERVISRGRSKK